jgi:uncharacterized membrane protein YdbT with pleckstrin-like domain
LNKNALGISFMGYVDANLLNEEKVVYRTRLHKILFFWPGLFAIALAVLGYWFFTQHQFQLKIAPYLAMACFVLAFLAFLPTYVKYISSEFAVTNKRVIMKVGFIQRQTVETLLQKVEAIEVQQTILGRIFNYGTISVVGTGGTIESIQMINNPLAFRRAVQEQADAKS